MKKIKVSRLYENTFDEKEKRFNYNWLKKQPKERAEANVQFLGHK